VRGNTFHFIEQAKGQENPEHGGAVPWGGFYTLGLKLKRASWTQCPGGQRKEEVARKIASRNGLLTEDGFEENHAQ